MYSMSKAYNLRVVMGFMHSEMLVLRVEVLSVGEEDRLVSSRGLSHCLAKLSRVEELGVPRLDEHGAGKGFRVEEAIEKT